ncbi:MAG TPA: hypothetical protein VKD02_04300 [Methyloceanibacter sp.]|nr:hypothetical protein [Methyloceanibacter sp.]
MTKSRVATAALVIAAVTMLSLAAAMAQGPGQGGQPPANPPATPEPSSAAKRGEGAAAGAKTEGGEPLKPTETAPGASAVSPAAPAPGDTPSTTLATLLQEGFQVRATSFVPADAVTRQSGKSSSDAILVTLQKAAVSAVCFYTLKAYVSKKLGTIPACTVTR